MVSRRRRRTRGMTLIEVLIALVVTTVGLLGALATVGVTIRSASFSRSATEASTLAQAQLEALVSWPGVTATNPPPGTTSTETQLDGNGMVNSTSGGYTRTTTWGTTGDGQRRLVTVTVTWIDGFNVTHQVTATRQKVPQ
jgi:prepilin-type N-terminal cleavage/methylation domain-containing protein